MLFNYINFLNEGEQAEEYMKKKKAEREEREKAEYEEDKKNAKRADINWRGGQSGKFNQSDMDPKLQKGKSMSDLRQRYPDDMPKTKSSSEKAYDDMRSKEKRAREYATTMSRKEVDRRYADKHNTDVVDPYDNPTEYNKMYDMFYRKKMKELKHESGIFESVTFLNETNSEEE